jgi:CubicO group peptidase (beta-lactamase class C family)
MWCSVSDNRRRTLIAITLVLLCVVLVAGLMARHPALPPVAPLLVARAAPATPVPVSTLSFDAALAEAATLPRIRSLLVSVDGTLAAERYFHGAAPGRPANMKSASKSIISALVGVAIHRGLIGSVHDPISRYLSEYVRTDPAKAAITIEDLLTMRTGLETTSNRNYGRWVSSSNWVRFVLDQPMVDEPGGRMIYSTGSTHLLSAILTRATKTGTLAFAQSALAAPLGITLGAWQRDPQGIFLGGNEMPMRPRDMLRIGELYLNGGRYQDRQIVPREWIQTSIVPRTTSRWSDREYGYGWWIRTLDDEPAFYAWGYGGQFIFVVPSVRLVVVTTSVAEPGSERRDHLDGIYDLMEDHIVPVARAAFPPAGDDE